MSTESPAYMAVDYRGKDITVGAWVSFWSATDVGLGSGEIRMVASEQIVVRQTAGQLALINGHLRYPNGSHEPGSAHYSTVVVLPEEYRDGH